MNAVVPHLTPDEARALSMHILSRRVRDRPLLLITHVGLRATPDGYCDLDVTAADLAEHASHKGWLDHVIRAYPLADWDWPQES